MNFSELVNARQSCRKFDADRMVENEKLNAILNAIRLAPSACNGQPYFVTVCRGEKAHEVAKATMGMGMNRFTADAPVMMVISEMPYNATAAMGAKLKKNDYRSIDIGIASAFLTLEATEQGLGSCILGWFDEKKIREICSIEGTVRLVVALGYPQEGDILRVKKRKDPDELFKFVE